jgi:PAS domain S-box-containing protein
MTQSSDRMRAEEAARRWEEIFQRAAFGVAIVNPYDDTFVAVNPAFAQIHGYTVDELAGSSLAIVFAPESLPELPEHARLVHERGHHVYESVHLRKDGSRFPALTDVTAFKNEKGEVLFRAAYFQDITDRTRAEEALRESERRFRALIENSSDGFVLLDREGCVLFSGPSILGYTAQQMRGQKVFDLIHPDEFEQTRNQLAQALQRPGDVITSEYRARHRDGSWRWIEAVSKNLLHDSTVGGIVVNYREVTARKRLEEQLRQSQKLESLGVLAGGVAHDFNNLLTGIMGNASIALSGAAATSADRALLEEIVHASERAADLTRQLLAYAGKGRFVIQQVDLSHLIRETQRLVRTSIPANVQLRLELARELPPVEGDLGQIQQVVMNLLINAAEAIAEGTPGTVRICTKVVDVDVPYLRANFVPHALALGPYVVLEVQDTGSGMDAATQAKIFDPFFTTKFAGRGLGLSAVQGIVRGHKGALQVNSAPGRGTTFSVFFPAAQSVPVEVEFQKQTQNLQGSETILVVDDDPIVRQTAKTALERYGYSVVVADNGRAAVDRIEAMADGISMVVLDLTMPVMDGKQALRHIWTNRPGMPVILSSGFDQAEAIRQFGISNNAAFIQKPYTAVQLAEKVKDLLESCR